MPHIIIIHHLFSFLFQYYVYFFDHLVSDLWSELPSSRYRFRYWYRFGKAITLANEMLEYLYWISNTEKEEGRIPTQSQWYMGQFHPSWISSKSQLARWATEWHYSLTWPHPSTASVCELEYLNSCRTDLILILPLRLLRDQVKILSFKWKQP